MLSRLLPERADNGYRGYHLALWLFAFVLIMRAIIGVNSMVNGHNVAINADGLPLDSYQPAAAQTVVTLFALLGFSNLLLALIGVVVLVRYRTLVPFMFAVLLLDYLCRKLIGYLMPIAKVGTPPGFYVGITLLAVMIVGLGLSLWVRNREQQ